MGTASQTAHNYAKICNAFRIRTDESFIRPEDSERLAEGLAQRGDERGKLILTRERKPGTIVSVMETSIIATEAEGCK